MSAPLNRGTAWRGDVSPSRRHALDLKGRGPSAGAGPGGCSVFHAVRGAHGGSPSSGRVKCVDARSQKIAASVSSPQHRRCFLKIRTSLPAVAWNNPAYIYIGFWLLEFLRRNRSPASKNSKISSVIGMESSGRLCATHETQFLRHSLITAVSPCIRPHTCRSSSRRPSHRSYSLIRPGTSLRDARRVRSVASFLQITSQIGIV
jgi:hypothetical protein